MPKTNYTHKALQDALFGKTSAFGALASRPTLYGALSTTEPTMAGGNVNEPTGDAGGGYARVATAPADWNAATDADPSEVTNATDINFPAVAGTGASVGAGDWGTLAWFVVFDAPTGGNVVDYSALLLAKNPTEGDVVTVKAGEAKLRFRSPA